MGLSVLWRLLTRSPFFARPPLAPRSALLDLRPVSLVLVGGTRPAPGASLSQNATTTPRTGNDDDDDDEGAAASEAEAAVPVPAEHPAAGAF